MATYLLITNEVIHLAEVVEACAFGTEDPRFLPCCWTCVYEYIKLWFCYGRTEWGKHAAFLRVGGLVLKKLKSLSIPVVVGGAEATYHRRPCSVCCSALVLHLFNSAWQFPCCPSKLCFEGEEGRVGGGRAEACFPTLLSIHHFLILDFSSILA